MLYRKPNVKWMLPIGRGLRASLPEEQTETELVAEIEWKGAVWRAAYGDLSIKELLTILKGFGPMEILEFEKPGCCKGQISLSSSTDGKKEITLYHLEVSGDKRQGLGREALQWLRKIFKGELYVEDPGIIRVRNANAESLRFWVRMFREGIIDALDSEMCQLYPEMTETEIQAAEERINSSLESRKAKLA